MYISFNLWSTVPAGFNYDSICGVKVMIQLIEAPPRSGKSYFVCFYLYLFCKFNELYNEYVLNDNVLIISNIEGLRCKHWKLDVVLKNQTLLDFFMIENFENIMKKTGKTHIILAVDECHKLFPASLDKNSQKHLYNFFAEHGHIGLDVFLMTQGIQSMARLFNPLLEFVVKASIRSKSVKGVFSYKYYDLEGKFLYSKILTKKKEVFGLYKSFRHDEQNKPKNALFIWVATVFVFLTVAGGVFYSGLNTLKEKSEIAASKSGQAPAGSVTISSASGPPPVKKVPPGQDQSVVASPVVSPELAELSWRTYHVDGYLMYEHGDIFIINGKRIGGDRCRNFDSELMTIQFFGPPLPDRSRTSGAIGQVSSVGGLASPAQAGALATATDLQPKVNEFNHTFPITDAERSPPYPRPDKYEKFL